MITKNVEGKLELDIFRRFVVDKSLPKYKSTQEYEKSSGGIFVTTSMMSDEVSEGWNVIGGSSKSHEYDSNKTFWGWVLSQYKIFKRNKELRKVEMNKVPVEIVFERVSKNLKNLTVLKERLKKHRDALKYAKKMGQTALFEELSKKSKAVELEEVLYAHETTLYIEEQDLINFAQNCERGLRLDWIKNFNRMIPFEGGQKKIELDNLCVFDNYVVLHYDPENKATKLTDEERKKKEDPILFGVIEGSRKLYHVFSWKDELCDLTIDQIIEKYPEKVKELK